MYFVHGELNDMQLSGEIQRILDLEIITKYTFLQLRIEIPCLYNKLKPEKNPHSKGVLVFSFYNIQSYTLIINMNFYVDPLTILIGESLGWVIHSRKLID